MTLGGAFKAAMLGAIAMTSRAQRRFFPDFHLEQQRRGGRPRDFWKRKRYPLEELRRLRAERGVGSVKRVHPRLRQSWQPTAR